MLILAVNSLAVNGALPLYVESKSVLYTQYSVKKCLVHFMKRLTRSPCFSRYRFKRRHGFHGAQDWRMDAVCTSFGAACLCAL